MLLLEYYRHCAILCMCIHGSCSIERFGLLESRRGHTERYCPHCAIALAPAELELCMKRPLCRCRPCASAARGSEWTQHPTRNMLLPCGSPAYPTSTALHSTRGEKWTLARAVCC